jgi:hypothetical protein
MEEAMSEEGSFRLRVIEGLAGAIIFIIGIAGAFYTFTSLSTLGNFVGFFGFLSITTIVIGLILMTAKIEE